MRVRHRLKTLRLLLVVALVFGGGWLAVVAYDQGFTNRWKNRIVAELEKQGIAAQIERLTIDPINGLTARNVRLFDMANRHQLLADISNISLDVDLGKIVEGTDFLRTVDLRRASLTLPVNPLFPNGEAVQIRELNARLHFEGDRVEIARADGNISGVQLILRGGMDLPKRPKGTKEEREQVKKDRIKQLDAIKQRRGALHDWLHFLDQFKTNRSIKATVEIEVKGPLSNFEEVEARVKASAVDLQCGDFRLVSLDAEAQLSNGMLSLDKFSLADEHGQLHGQASWLIGKGREIDFWLDSSIDAHALLKSLWKERALGEVVFYKPPHVRMDGKVLLTQPTAEEKAHQYLPLQVVGRVESQKFTTRGVIFTGIQTEFALNRSSFNIRNFLLQHENRTASGRVQFTPEHGLKYYANWNLKLGAALPFVESDAVQQFLTSFEFHEGAYVNVEAQGAGGSLDPLTWTGSVHVDLRNFSYRNVLIESVSTEATLAGGKVVARNILLQRPDGEVRVDQFNMVPVQKFYGIEGMVSTTQPLPLIKAILPHLTKSVEPYVFSAPPTLKIQGRIYDRPHSSKSDLLVEMQSPSKVTCNIGATKYPATNVAGSLRWRDDAITLALTGKGLPGTSHSNVTCDREPDLKFTGTFGVEANLGKISTWTLLAKASEEVYIKFAGKPIPAQSLDLKIIANQRRLDVEGTARVYGGGLKARFAFPDTSKIQPYEASVSLDRIGFAPLAKLFDGTKNTQGYLTGTLDFTGMGDQSNSIKGTGRLLITNGDIFAVPLLGPLSKLFSAIPGVGSVIYGVAEEATADLTVERGTVSTTKFEAQTSTFRLLVNGQVDYVNDRVDLTARMNLRGVLGISTFLLSKLFEYEALGSLGTPEWKPKHLGIPFIGNDGRKGTNPP